MQKTFESVYENGVLRPLEALPLEDGQHVCVTISESPARTADASAFFSPAEWQAAQQDPITLEEVQNALSSITGSLSETVIALREDRA